MNPHCERELAITAAQGGKIHTDGMEPVLIPDSREAVDPGIRRAVDVLRAAGVETFESCQGGTGHAYDVPAVRFHGDRSDGFRALAAAMQHGLPVVELRRVWRVEEGEPVGPCWELTLHDPTS